MPNTTGEGEIRLCNSVCGCPIEQRNILMLSLFCIGQFNIGNRRFKALDCRASVVFRATLYIKSQLSIPGEQAL